MTTEGMSVHETNFNQIRLEYHQLKNSSSDYATVSRGKGREEKGEGQGRGEKLRAQRINDWDMSTLHNPDQISALYQYRLTSSMYTVAIVCPPSCQTTTNWKNDKYQIQPSDQQACHDWWRDQTIGSPLGQNSGLMPVDPARIYGCWWVCG